MLEKIELLMFSKMFEGVAPHWKYKILKENLLWCQGCALLSAALWGSLYEDLIHNEQILLLLEKTKHVKILNQKEIFKHMQRRDVKYWCGAFWSLSLRGKGEKWDNLTLLVCVDGVYWLCVWWMCMCVLWCVGVAHDKRHTLDKQLAVCMWG